ncbi:unnamed protein product [Prorocentrum cordatum]|uniref:Nascent polypeptide-associated complex subunit alpha-like UBA domain-containing protein n=1 Tax=Prorocentrum cordatum TaxID=2364126 RepID=A0ABN9S1H4_9DINO|nr:unnamed protein product [Polarella glacialis]
MEKGGKTKAESNTASTPKDKGLKVDEGKEAVEVVKTTVNEVKESNKDLRKDIEEIRVSIKSTTGSPSSSAWQRPGQQDLAESEQRAKQVIAVGFEERMAASKIATELEDMVTRLTGKATQTFMNVMVKAAS